MWSTSNNTRNRVSPDQTNFQENGNVVWDDESVTPNKTEKHPRDIQIQNGKNYKKESSTKELTVLIRKRKYDVIESQFGNLLNKTDTNGRARIAGLTERLKNKSYEKPVKSVKGCDAWRYRQKQSWRKFKINLREIGYKLELWRSWFKKVEGHQGTGVLSYFIFLKWLFFLNIYIFLLILGFIVIPPVALNEVVYPITYYNNNTNYTDYTSPVTPTGYSEVDWLKTNTCSVLYTVNQSNAAADVIQDFIQGTGWMEKTGLFYGWYDSKALDLPSYHVYLMPFAYFMTVLAVLFLSLVRMARFTIASFKENLDEGKEHSKTDYCNKVFGGWDYALYDEVTCQGKSKSIYKDIVAHLEHQKYMLTRATRSGCDKCKVYTIRFIVNLLIVAILGGSGYLIYWVNNWSTTYLAGVSTSGSVIVLIVEFLPSLTITLLNVLDPLLFGILVKFEDYTEDVIVKLTLIRTVFLKLASLTVLMVSLYVNIICSDTDATCNVGQGSCTAIRCWETYVGQAFYKLMVFDFLVHVLVIFCSELPRKLLTTKCKASICVKIGPAEFDVSKSVLDLVYTQALCWIGVLYCPLITACAVISSFTQFYLKLFSALITTVPPKKPYKASKSNNFFMIVLMVTFGLCCFPVGYSMVKIRPSTGCGPFRIYSDMSITVDVTITNLPYWAKNTVDIFTSAAFIIALLTILCLTIYYLHVRGKAHNERAEIMIEQLVMEGKDKQFLLAKIYELSGEGPKPKPQMTKPNPTVQTEYVIPSEKKTRQFIEDNVPPPPAYQENESPLFDSVVVQADDKNKTPVQVARESPPPPSSPTLFHSEPTKTATKSNIKPTTKVSHTSKHNLIPSDMPFEF